jgi:serine-type D-Ala-D-Ala endopeptidase (penicillin-binding protein 7)
LHCQEDEVYLRFLLFTIALTLSFSIPAAWAAQGDGSSEKRTSVSTAKAKAKAKVKAKIRAKTRLKSRIAQRSAYAQKIAHSPSAIEQLDEGIGSELRLASAKALILNQETGEVLYAKSTDMPTPIASVTKLMTAMVVLDARQPMDELLTVTSADVDTLKRTSSRLPVGATLTRAEMLQLALMSSENRAASALGHAYPGGYQAFVNAMNVKAMMLGMTRTQFLDATGLNSGNISTAEDLAKMVNAAYEYPEIRQVTTSPSYAVEMNGMRRPAEFRNTNILVRNSDWNIGLSKTGFINEAGRCLVMQALIAGQPLIIVLLDSAGKYTRIGDANRIRKWIESNRLLAKMG